MTSSKLCSQAFLCQQPWLVRAKNNISEILSGQRQFAFKFDIAGPDTFVGGQENVAAQSKGKGLVIKDHALDFDGQMKGLSKRFELGYEDDWVYMLRPYTGVGMFASIFGCRSEIPMDADPITHPIINSLDQITGLKVNWESADLFNLSIEKIEYFKSQINGEIPIASPDLQSPINTASIICNYGELIYELMVNPEKGQNFLATIADVMIEAVDKLVEAGIEPGVSRDIWLPKGIWLSDDLMDVLGPQVYGEFAIPAANKLSQHFGGIALHSCGNPVPCAEVLKDYDNLIGLDFWEATIKDFRQAGGDYLCFSPVIADPWHNIDRRTRYKSSQEVARVGLEDLKRLPEVLTGPTFLKCVCPDQRYADEYYDLLLSYSKEFNN